MPSAMSWTVRGGRIVVALAAAAVVAGGAARAADLPKSTQEYIKQLKLSEDVLKGLDQELAVPQAWIDGARKSPVVKIGGSDEPPDHAKLVRPFLERYPFIKVEYQRGSANERVIRPLIAFGEGRYLMDVIRSMDGSLHEFLKIDAAANLKDLPAYGSALSGAHDEQGYAVAFRSRPYCMSYNTNLVKKEQLPKTWADLPNSPHFGNGRIGVVMLPHLWVMPLWHKYGESWAVKYIDDFFVNLKPQVRREGLNAAMSLVGAGENHISIPAYPERIKELQDKGGPIGWYCPEIVPLRYSKMAIFRGSPGFDAGRLYTNWLLSKEGQIAQMAVFDTPPVHKDLQDPNFHIYPEAVAGREFVSYDDTDDTERFLTLWNKYAAGGRR